MKVWVVQGRHQYVSGCPMRALASETSANTAAAELVTIMLKDAGVGKRAGNASWEGMLRRLQKMDGCGDADVWINALDLED